MILARPKSELRLITKRLGNQLSFLTGGLENVVRFTRFDEWERNASRIK